MNRKKYVPTSYGIIPYFINENSEGSECEYLIVQRRDTIEYLNFIKGKFHPSTYLKYFQLMTREEIERIKNHNFDELWSDLWVNQEHKLFKEQYAIAKHIFYKNKEYAMYCINSIVPTIEQPPWEFTKGRKLIGESPLNTALREFEEETKISKNLLVIDNRNIISETFYGSDNKKYCIKFLLARSKEKFTIKNIETPKCIREYSLSEEIMNAKWVTYDRAIEIVSSPYKNILKKSKIVLQINL